MARKTAQQEEYNLDGSEDDEYDEETEEKPKKQTKKQPKKETPKQQPKKQVKRIEEDDETEDDEEEKPKKQTKKQPKKETEEKPKKETKKETTKQPKKETSKTTKQEFNLKSMIRFLNSCYDEFNFKDITSLKKDKKATFKINLNDYKAIDEFKKVVNEFEKLEESKETRTKETEKWNMITQSVYDFKLRGILTLLNDFKLQTKDEKTEEKDTRLFMDYIIPQLHFNEPEGFEVSQVRENMIEFLTSDKIKFKLYNNMFPHPKISTDNDKKENRLNKIYLQNISNYHDKYLEMLYSGKVSKAEDLYAYACEQIAYKSTIGTTKERLMKLSFGNKIKYAKDEKQFEKDDKIARFEHNMAQRYFACYSQAIEQGLITQKEAAKRYNEYIEKIEQYKEHAEELTKDKSTKLDKFINLFVSEFRTLNEDIKYNNSIKNYIADIKATNILTFTPQFKQILTKLINGENIKINYKPNKRFTTTIQVKDKKTGTMKDKEIDEFVIRERRHTFENTRDTLAKIGLVGGDNINKNVRIGVGISMVDYIHEEAIRITARSKLPKKTIYIEF